MKLLFKESATIIRALRRKYYMYFRKAHIRAMLARRKGSCGRHGCCDMSLWHHHRRCLSRADRTACLQWQNLPEECRIYPFDEKDKIPETRAYCNFYWE